MTPGVAACSRIRDHQSILRSDGRARKSAVVKFQEEIHVAMDLICQYPVSGATGLNRKHDA